jgi:hypothetical protein
MFSRILLAISVIALCTTHSAGQRGQSNPGYSTTEINTGAASLPPNFSGNSLAAVYSVMKGRQDEMDKREFETTDQYKTRIAVTKARPIIGSLGIHNRFAFVLEDVDAKYDADNHNLHLAIRADYSRVRSQTAKPIAERNLTITAMSSLTSQGEYIGQNAFGAKWRIVRGTEVLWYLECPGDALQQGATVDFDVALAQAPHYKRNLRFLMIGRLASPYANGSVETTTATIDKPTELTLDERSVYFKPEAWWLYDLSNGRIIHKQSLVNKPPEVVAGEQKEANSADLPEWARDDKSVKVYRAPGSPFYHHSMTCKGATPAVQPLSLAEAKKIAHACPLCEPKKQPQQ